MLRAVSRTALCVLCIAGVLSLCPAVEPDGFLRIRPGWLQDPAADPPSNGKILRLNLESLAAVENADLVVTLPREIGIAVLTPAWSDRFRFVEAPEGKQALRASLGDLPRSANLLIEFEFFRSEDEAGIVSFRVEGSLEGGRPISEAAGATLGHPGTRPVLRHGAMEFPAVVYPEDPS